MINKNLITDFTSAIKEAVKDSSGSYDTTAEVLRVDEDGCWVHIPGGVDETPVEHSIQANPGDTVQVRVANGRAWITGNNSAPPTDDTTAIYARTVAVEAGTAAAEAYETAEEAITEATTAAAAAASAKTSADEAAAAASAAQTSADEAATAAATAEEHAQAAIADAATAQGAANAAQTSADNAQQSADDAMTAAESANTSANSALTQLSIVEDVVDVLTWISDHGTYAKTSDTDIVPGKYYFTRSGSSGNYTYTVVPNPVKSSLSSYYELSGVDEAVSNYIASHLALTDQGLWLVNDNNGWKILIKNTGIEIYNASGTKIVEYGSSITFNSSTPFSMGSSSAGITFDGSAITIKGANVTFANGNTIADYAETDDIPTKTSDLTNDSNFATTSDIPTKTSDLTNDSNFATTSQTASTVQRIYYKKSTASAPTAPTSWVTSTSTSANTWTTKRMPYDSNYKYLYTCVQTKPVSGNPTCSTVLLDDTTTVIDGGNIITGSVTANQIDATNLHVSAANVDGTLTIGQLPSTVAETSDIPTAVSELTNDANYVNATTAQGYASSAQSAAEATASADATAKANAAQAAAEATAAADATAKANDAAKTATNFITTISGGGIKVHDAGDTSNYSKIDSTGMEVYQNGSSVASFGSSARIGKTGESRIVQDYHSFKMVDRNDNEYVSLEDLRDASGTANIKVFFIGDGSTKVFALALPATNNSYTVTVSDSSGGTITKATNTVTFSSAPTSGAEITVTYATTSELAKAFTFGTRDSTANVGGLSFAEGYEVAASGMNSHAEGRGTAALGNQSHAEGFFTVAYTDAHAEGIHTQALTGAAHAEGYFTTASGYYGTHSEGFNAVASGDYSHAQNEWTIAAKYAQTALGKYNIEDTTSGDYGKYAAIIGNGTSSARSNAFALTWTGDTEFECKSGDDLYTAINAAGWISEVTA